MPRPAYGTHHEQTELAALLHQLAEGETAPGERLRRRLIRLAFRLEGPMVERLAAPLGTGLEWLRRPRRS